MLILASICTYAFTASVKVMKNWVLYSHVDYQLEPVYGIILAYFLLVERKMSFSFYVEP
jgi:hypothetical protein